MPGVDSPPDVNILELVRISGMISGAIALAATWFIVKMMTSTLAKLGTRFTDKRLLLQQIGTLGRFVLYLGGLAVAVTLSVNLSRDVVLALTGTAAVTIGFALKDLAASVLAGIIIIVDRPFQVGDRVTFAGVYGEISSIGLRSVRLITLDDNVVTIPNNKFLTDVVSSSNWGALEMMMQLDFFVGVDQDISLAKRLVGECLTSCRYASVEKPWDVVVNQVLERDYFAVRLRAQAYVLDVKYEKAFQTDVSERVLDAFREHGVLAPAVLHREIGPSHPRAGAGASGTGTAQAAAHGPS
jgi:small-conductance mechanosensitive channel